MLNATDEEKEEVAEYFKWQAPDLTMTFLQKVYSEAVLGHVHDVWDVHTDKDRWWVITNPTNLYSQEQFPNLDLAVTFHIGLCLRVPRSEKRGLDPRRLLPFGEVFKQLEQATETLTQAKGVADYQGIGVRCRETLLSFIAAAQDAVDWGDGERPKRADLKGWVDRILGAALVGSAHKERRHLLRSLLVEAWDFANWLTHTKSPSWHDAEMSVATTEHALGIAASLVVRHIRGVPDECPQCGSPDLTPEEGRNSEILGVVWERPVCQDCGWVGSPMPIYEEPPEETDAIIRRAATDGEKECAIMEKPFRSLKTP
ncbi:hypothetical protein ELI41_23625 [Rhizobium leguminosarum]|jgi:hypothetical protein|uniref:hypothetical protein n=1 Tax=Rhizobium leguminosarum TaxID=384 RepID=UPI0010313DE2|nr:hypothetical protein [Rhizobium leguminosarum]TAU91314.1 hypothetical protein ELI41_23625 [Rhizobium leguminosarum]